AAGDAGCDVETRNFDADTVTPLERIGGRHDLDRVFVDLAGYDRFAGRTRERMPRPAGQRSFRIDCAVGRIEPAAGELAFVQARDVAFAFARGLHGHVRAQVLENDDPVGVILVDRRVEIKHARAGDGEICRQRLAHIPQLL